MLDVLFILAISVEAATGTIIAGKKQMDPFGILIIANATAFGGGILRDITLNNYPLIWIEHPHYLLITSASALFIIIIRPLIRYLTVTFYILDAIGLITFSIIGAQKALSLGYHPIIASIMAVFTGAFGGVLRDILCNETPLIFRKELYGSLSFLAAWMYMSLEHTSLVQTTNILTTLIICVLLRLLAIRMKINLPLIQFWEQQNQPAKTDRNKFSKKLKFHQTNTSQVKIKKDILTASECIHRNQVNTVSYSSIPAGRDLPRDLNAVIEIPANTIPIKYEVDKDMDALVVDRFMPTTMFYPANYGYIPRTLAQDDDPLDILVITPTPVVPGSIIRCRPVGMLRMSDESGNDEKIIAVPHDKLSTLYCDISDYNDLPSLLIKQIEHFFENYKALEPNKWVKIAGWSGLEEACTVIMKSANDYTKTEKK